MQITDPRYNNEHPIQLTYDRYATTFNIRLDGTILNPEFPEPFATYSTNITESLPDDHVALKTWSEGTGTEQVLLRAGVIEGEVLGYVTSGFVEIPIYKLTERAIKELGISE